MTTSPPSASRLLGTTFLAWVTAAAAAQANPVSFGTRTLAGAVARVAEIDLADPATVLTLRLADHPPAGEVLRPPAGDAPFARLVAATGAAVAVNGTFFSLGAAPRTMGTIVADGRLVHHVSWRPHGTSFGLRPGNVPVMGPAPEAWWRDRWLSVTAGPRLLRDGAVRIDARREGFMDPHVTGVATRTALGYDRAGRRLWLVSFATPVSLATAARGMKALGCWQAMNLDGGTSRALAERGRITVAPGRGLTNVLAAYDAANPAPPALARAFRDFRRVRSLPRPLGGTDPGPFACGAGRPPQRVGRRGYDFEDWRFVPAGGRPVATNRDGWLEVAGGALFARWPVSTPPAGAFRLSFLARALGPTFGFTAGNLAVSYHAPSGEAALRQGAAVLGRAIVGRGDAERHLVRLETAGRDARVYVDGRLVGASRDFRYGAGLTLAPGTSVTWLLSERPRRAGR